MKCPSCKTPLVSDPERCPHCGFAYQELVRKFGAAPKYDARVTDITYKELTVFELRRIDKLLTRYERKFPQSRFCVLFLDLRIGWDLAEYTFYLANRCNFLPPAIKEADNKLVLMAVDYSSGQVAMATGYGLEPYLGEDDMRAVLEAVAAPLARKKYVAAVKLAVARTMNHLARQAAA